MHKTRTHKHRPRRPVWGDWSDWIWSPEHGTYYRARQDSDGNCEYDFHPGGGATADEIPRQAQAAAGDPSIEDITHGINQLSATSYSYSPESAYAHSSESPGGPSEQAEYSYTQSRHDPDEEAVESVDQKGEEAAEPVGEKGKEKEEPSYDNDETGVDDVRLNRAESTVAAAYGLDQGQSAAEIDDDAALQAAINLSRGLNQSRAGESSSTGQVYAYEPCEVGEDEGPSTPKPFDIRGTGGEIEALDPRYVVEPSSRFQPGEVFKVLWAEPSGNVGGTPTISDKRALQDQYGGAIYVGFRRYIVIGNDEGHCTCVPILTYGGKACKKKGVKPHKHGIIYVQGHRPKPLDNEPKLGFSPARMKIEAEGEKLAKESRANYSKLVTVEHNVKVFFIGHIIPEDWDIVLDAVDKCWENKIKHQRRKTRK
ncbi:hypothetical protein SODALDRAFT_322431 [Sodiomyces alkalinus F11]|uniref:DUF6590 domain-containing protein n=1 Tax=Sodiomyces alkalinus (strain CBS 110278 / VKM F-3762 / F11) TaxID=1314773 RepID=A0A3N2Q3A9_SODAK|nr:hypothetical protein SODALDRAFT_322431 [Sodiomyces alkalinus F11]ROT41254.1 hypothetical protein SODALDRAFT_322431 [Sodiomyces alkalinus F11]